MDIMTVSEFVVDHPDIAIQYAQQLGFFIALIWILWFAARIVPKLIEVWREQQKLAAENARRDDESRRQLLELLAGHTARTATGVEAIGISIGIGNKTQRDIGKVLIRLDKRLALIEKNQRAMLMGINRNGRIGMATLERVNRIGQHLVKKDKTK